MQTSEEWLEKISKVCSPNQKRLLPISDIQGRIMEVVSARIYTITKEMVDLDHAGVNMITKVDFRTVCDHHFMRLTDEQVSLNIMIFHEIITSYQTCNCTRVLSV